MRQSPASRIASRAFFLTLALCASPTATALDWLYLTAPGDTLIGIGQRYLKNANDWPKIQIANKVPVPKQLPSNSHLRIPVDLLKVTPAPARVAQVQGNVRMRNGNGLFQPLKPGDSLNGGETVLTGPRSSASYVLADGSKLTQADSTKLIFGRLAAYGATGMVSTELNLEAGRIEADASKQTFPGTGFKVATPVAVAGLRGTSFRLNMSEDGKTLRNEVLAGAVGVEAQRREALVNAGQGTRAEAGKPPEAPRPLLAAPQPTSLPARVTETPLRFAWLESAGAQAWRAQIAKDAEFRSVVLDDVFHQPRAVWSDNLADGAYHLRLRAIDGAGLEGFNFDHAFQLATLPRAPRAIEPSQTKPLVASPAWFAWDPADGASGYVLEVAPDPTFKTGVQERRVMGETRVSLDLPPGDYHWRLASLDQQGQTRAWGPTHHFQMSPVAALPAPTDLIGVLCCGVMNLAWRGNAPYYRVEIASDPGFKDIVGRHLSFGPRALINWPKRGIYWWRVVPLSKEGAAGLVSEAAAAKTSWLF